jgi:hypothetical protein
MIAIEKSPETCTLRSANLELSFSHIGDRWQHRVCVRGDGRWLPLLVSEEGAADGENLPSPAFQDLRCEELPGGAFEFQLLGQAGKAIYSAAVRFDDSTQTIDIDVCARAPTTQSHISTYGHYLLVNDDSAIDIAQRAGSLIVLRDAGGIEIKPVTIPGNPPGECRSIDDGAVRRIVAGCFEAPMSGGCGRGVSVRWRYQMTPVGSP